VPTVCIPAPDFQPRRPRPTRGDNIRSTHDRRDPYHAQRRECGGGWQVVRIDLRDPDEPEPFESRAV
jgi:hypothetical protein